MVAASKMRKAVDTALVLAPMPNYWDILVDLSKTADVKISLLETRPVKMFW